MEGNTDKSLLILIQISPKFQEIEKTSPVQWDFPMLPSSVSMLEELQRLLDVRGDHPLDVLEHAAEALELVEDLKV